MFDGNLRHGVDAVTEPIGRNLVRLGVGADQLTLLGLVMSGVAAVAIAFGSLRLGLALLILTAIPDLLDGAVAKAAGTTSLRGAFFDSTADRVTDAGLLGGIAYYLADTRDGRLAVLAFAVMAVSAVISYERAKAELLGFEAKGGLMERAERMIVLGFGLAFDSLLVPVLWVMLVLTSITAIQRFFKVWHQASEVHPAPTPRLVASNDRRRARVNKREARRASSRSAR
jgi:CDP-diacylglycerol---glycerol-3-phosphate 3-phosphatidyltransferase